MRLFTLILLSFLAVGCASTPSHISMGNGKFMTSISDKSFGASNTDAIEKAMTASRQKCGDKELIVLDVKSTPRGIGQFASGTVIYKCK